LNKKGQLSTILKLIIIVIVITIIANIFLDKNFFTDAIDSVRNILKPPEIDPMPSTTRMMVQREKGFDYLSGWVDTLHMMTSSDEEYCYKHLPATSRDSREEELSVVFSTQEEDSFKIKLTQKGAAVSREITINSPLCLIAQPKRSATNNADARKILENFRDAFHSNDEAKIRACINNPESCALILTKPSQISSQYSTYEAFRSEFTINSHAVRDKRTSFTLNYQITQNGENKNIFNVNSGILSDAGYLLFKISANHVCIMPIANSGHSCEPWYLPSNRNAGEIQLLRRSCFFKRGSFEPTDELMRLPECVPKTYMTEEEAQQLFEKTLLEFGQTIEFKAEFKGEEEQTNKLVFAWTEMSNSWWLILPNPRIGQTLGEDVKIEALLDEESEDNILPLHEEIKKMIIDLRDKNKEQGITYFLTYENDELESITINNKEITQLKTILKQRGADGLILELKNI
jgi:hypothetical protein